MQLILSQQALEDLIYWAKNDRKMTSKILKLVREITETPFTGTGKPEPLKHNLSGLWSRRINGEHRIVYRVKDENVIIFQCRYHY